MIADGQNRFHQVACYSFVYRPLLPQTRNALWRELKRLPEHLFRIAVHEIVDRQIVCCDWSDGSEHLPSDVFEEVFRVITTAPRDETNLYRGARLALEYPHLAQTSCRSCIAWWWNPLSGQLIRDREGQPIRRQPGSVLLCQTPEGCPKGTPDHPVEFTPENQQAYEHYQMAGGQGCPDDDLTRRNWAIITKAKTDVERDRVRQRPPTYGRATPRGHAATRP